MFPTRLIALVLAVTAFCAPLEPIWGELRDGEVHHEPVEKALRHALSEHSEHAHEQDAEQAPDQDSDHQHGSCADHCTHQHGTSMPAPVIEIFAGGEANHLPANYAFVLPEWTFFPQLDPPRG